MGNPPLSPRLPWAPKDLAAIALITVATNVIAVPPSVPASNLKEFIAYVKDNTGKLNYSCQGNGSLSHIGTERFKLQTGTRMVHIPYCSSGPAVQCVLSGQVQVFITTPPSVMGYVQAGKLKGLAVAGKARQPGLPSVPTTAEAELKGFELEAWVGIFAPAGTPAEVISKLSRSIKQAIELPETKTRANNAGIALRCLAPADLNALIMREMDSGPRPLSLPALRRPKRRINTAGGVPQTLQKIALDPVTLISVNRDLGVLDQPGKAFRIVLDLPRHLLCRIANRLGADVRHFLAELG